MACASINGPITCVKLYKTIACGVNVFGIKKWPNSPILTTSIATGSIGELIKQKNSH